MSLVHTTAERVSALELLEGLREAMSSSAVWFQHNGIWGLSLLSAVEAICFPVPPDTVLIPLVHNTHDKGVAWALLLALVTTLTSVGGSLIGYWIGVKGGRPVLNRIVHNPERIARAEAFFERYGAWAIAVAGFTPIPYKVFAICGGVFRVNLVGFTLGGLVGRGLRFFMVALAVYYFGESIMQNLDVVFKVSLGLVLAYVIYLVVRARLRKRAAASPAEDETEPAEEKVAD